LPTEKSWMSDIGFYGDIPTPEQQQEREKQRAAWQKAHSYVDDMNLQELQDYIKSVLISLSDADKKLFLDYINAS
jgi:hypothetical protein